MSKRVVIFLRGGLGNQLFQICTGERLRLEYGCTIYYSDLFLRGVWFKTKSNTRENFAEKIGLPIFQCAAPKGLLIRITIATAREISVLLKREIRVGKLLTSQEAISSDLKRIPEFLDSPGFEEVTDRDSLQMKALMEHVKIAPLIDLGLFSAVHIRLGDYASLPHIYGQPSQSFLNKAFSHIRRDLDKGAIKKVIVFSDEPSKAREYVPSTFPEEKIIMSNEICKSDLEEFFLMTKAHEIWIANSTFSWWAARISEARNVYFPQEFMGPSLKLPQYALPRSWKGES